VALPINMQYGKKKASSCSPFQPRSFDFLRWHEILDDRCVGVTVAGCCKRNSSSVSLGTFTCCPFVSTWTPAPAAEPAPCANRRALAAPGNCADDGAGYRAAANFLGGVRAAALPLQSVVTADDR